MLRLFLRSSIEGCPNIQISDELHCSIFELMEQIEAIEDKCKAIRSRIVLIQQRIDSIRTCINTSDSDN